MKIIDIIRKIMSRLITPNTCSNEAFVNYLKKHGMKIGKHTRFIYPKKCHVDIHRAEYIEIGDNCCLVQIKMLAHDYSWYILNEKYNDMLPDPGGKITIGNNCFIGYDSLILKNTTIGNNVIIGARSVVKGNIPSNTVWAGVPAKQICTLDEYYKKLKNKEEESLIYRKRVLDERENYKMEDYGFFMLYFIERTEENYNKYIKNIEFNGEKNTDIVRNYFFSTVPKYKNYEDFIKNQNDVNNN